MFDRYLNKPEATAKEFHDGWFKTGDYVSQTDGVFRILGRISQDIIKKAGFKISALEIEGYLLEH
jgi:malonyl-CoA/methylmalonyl-CoA synthetase